MKSLKTIVAVMLIVCCSGAVAQRINSPKSNIVGKKSGVSAKPRLVVGVMVDQMRWDYLYRFQHRYGQNGLKRVLREGFSCENAQISYAQTVTAAGHASV